MQLNPTGPRRPCLGSRHPQVAILPAPPAQGPRQGLSSNFSVITALQIEHQGEGNAVEYLKKLEMALQATVNFLIL